MIDDRIIDKMRLKKAYDYLTERFESRLFSDNYGISGEWILRYYGKFIFINKKKEALSLVNELFVDRSNTGIMRKLKEYLWNFVCLRYRKNVHNSDNANVLCIMFSNDLGDYYIYYSNGVIKKIYRDDRIVRNMTLLNNSNYWNVFKTPVIWKNKNIVIEKMIHKVDTSLYDSKLYEDILDAYIEYFSLANSTRQDTLGYLLDSYGINENNKSILFDKNILNLKINSYMQHGDFWYYNILKGEELYVIDCDQVGEYPFFFDIFEYIWAIYINYGELLFFDRFLKNKDSLQDRLKVLFMNQGIDYSDMNICGLFLAMGLIRHVVYCERERLANGSTNWRYEINSRKKILGFARKYGLLSGKRNMEMF